MIHYSASTRVFNQHIKSYMLISKNEELYEKEFSTITISESNLGFSQIHAAQDAVSSKCNEF